ncbi:hypothetical protein [Bradyrhizobium sp.]|jgi:hypothetical protein|uniref:hypothetical protein n=1 Tax=Bradyrhizobium sp. TaxID=376 RepID=UPI003C2351A1
MSGADRQARYRARHATPAPAAARPRMRPRDRTRLQRWGAAVAEIVALQGEYGQWLEALPEALRDTPTGEALQDIVDLDLEDLVAIQPPRGYGRDQTGPAMGPGPRKPVMPVQPGRLAGRAERA